MGKLDLQRRGLDSDMEPIAPAPVDAQPAPVPISVVPTVVEVHLQPSNPQETHLHAMGGLCDCDPPSPTCCETLICPWHTFGSLKQRWQLAQCLGPSYAVNAAALFAAALLSMLCTTTNIPGPLWWINPIVFLLSSAGWVNLIWSLRSEYFRKHNITDVKTRPPSMGQGCSCCGDISGIIVCGVNGGLLFFCLPRIY